MEFWIFFFNFCKKKNQAFLFNYIDYSVIVQISIMFEIQIFNIETTRMIDWPVSTSFIFGACSQ